MELVFDIETAGYDFDSLTEGQKEYLLRFANKEKHDEVKEEKTEESKRYLSLYPFTSNLVSIAMLNPETEKTVVLYNSEQKETWETEDCKIKYIALSEIEILEKFWAQLKKVKTLISFNGKNFDLPFLILRSSVLKVKPSLTISTYKTKIKHIDLLDQLTMYGTIRKFNLNFYCEIYGIKSPKTDILNGLEVKEYFKSGRIKEIANYCKNDVVATYQLYKIYKEFLF